MPRYLLATLVVDRSAPHSHQLCQVVPFCRKTALLKARHGYDVAILTDHVWTNPLHSCRHTFQIVPDLQVLNVAKSYKTALDAIYFLKWTLAGLESYDVVVYVDTDIDIVRLQTDDFHRHLESFRESRYTISGQADWAVPLNSGAFALKPSGRIFRRGLRLAARHAGMGSFQALGSPRSLFNQTNVNPRFLNCKMIRGNTWKVPGGSSDQGLLSLLYVMQGNASHATHNKLGHFWWIHKPYLRCPRWVSEVRDVGEEVCVSIVEQWRNTSKGRCHKTYTCIL